MPHGKICYMEIPARAVEDAATFYTRVFGWTTRTRGDGALAFDDGHGMSGTWVAEEDHAPDEPIRTYVMVDDIDQSLRGIVEAGGRVHLPRTDLGPGNGAFAIFHDPAGNELGLYEGPRT